jgi:uncharacterized protein GlcG (DUF336 family)
VNLALAKKLIASARKQAEAMGRQVSIAVVDSGGNLVTFERMDGAPLVSVRLAQDKAYTAALLQMPTEALADMASPGGTLFGIHTTHGGRIVIFGGGVPVGEGAIGVSGAAIEEDVSIAKRAILSITTATHGQWWARVMP